MVKAYLKFDQDRVFGLISTSNSVLDRSGKLAITGCGERISVWDLRKQTLVKSIFEEDVKSEISIVSLSKDGTLLATGYSDGSIRIFSMNDYSLQSVFNGHRGSISCLTFNTLGNILVSGSKDTEIIVWDVITESGLFRLRGHRDMITAVRILERSNHLITSSKDGFIKIWDTETQHCIQTIVGHRNPIWNIDVNPDETRLVSCTSDNQIRIWRIASNEKARADGEKQPKFNVNIPINSAVSIPDEFNEDGTKKVNPADLDLEIVSEEEFAKYYGSITVKAESVSGVRFDPTNKILAVQSTGKFVDLFKITHYDIIKMDEISVTDEFRHRQTIKTSSKVRFFSFGNDVKTWNKFVITLAGNSLEAYEIKEDGFEVTSTLDQAGHRSDVRSLTLSSNDSMIASTSSESVKVWNMKSLLCIRSIPCDYGLCTVFAPGNLHIIVGTKTGSIEVFELASANKVASIKAHEGSVWSIALTPDLRGIVSGGADKQVKFWDFELITNPENPKQKDLNLSHSQTLKLESDVLAVKYSKNNKLLAVSLLDNTVKIFYSDTLKFHLSLYGHKLPVMCLDISDDSTLIITGSADKNIKIWGLDYGDCHKSFFAHDDSIMQLAFIPNTHHFISTSKDKRIKYWDGDKFEHIQTIDTHHGEVWSIAMGSVGDFFVTGSHDRSMRVFTQTETPIFVESDRQREMEQNWEATLEDDTRMRTKEMLEENAAAGKQSLETIMAGEEILDAIELVVLENFKKQEYEREVEELKKTGESLDSILPYSPNIMLLGLSPSDYLWNRMNRVRPSDLEEALRVLPFSVMRPLFEHFNEWVDQQGKNVEYIFKCSFFLIQTHQNQLSVSSEFIPILQKLNTKIKERLQNERNRLGFNRSALTFVKREIEINQQYKFFDTETYLNKNKNSKDSNNNKDKNNKEKSLKRNRK
ncbi:hypothetical protein DICPUDRAFT_159968 [Dictyostelium purpureum]|uniref:Small-subunit processome Utp12 domain-containing protein n=1 Tax=Dictyostelium purpureum TaxID=5786 RepID=F1A5E3_DICPU|nr:uncharacterized protein DICPUDRAFT_159968 [Dictyostelium purpureum]EGC28588.1 hypothetical protein DICPUDRAFT_159968 [Dictyostelium purpureum]|eukprot:XP_003294887.1 hypothetical protein DICPUDRAFT_159968 [Dictyostelium purpureum]